MADDVAVVVGVGAGLGWSLVRAFSRAGMRVVAASRNPQRLEAARRAENLARTHLISCDASRESDVVNLFTKIETDFQAPSLVVFNGGPTNPDGSSMFDLKISSAVGELVVWTTFLWGRRRRRLCCRWAQEPSFLLALLQPR